MGTLHLVLHQHVYRPKVTSNDRGAHRKLWVCSAGNSSGREGYCPAKCYSTNGKLVSKIGMHNHPPPRDFLLAKQAQGKIVFHKLV